MNAVYNIHSFDFNPQELKLNHWEISKKITVVSLLTFAVLGICGEISMPVLGGIVGAVSILELFSVISKGKKKSTYNEQFCDGLFFTTLIALAALGLQSQISIEQLGCYIIGGFVATVFVTRATIEWLCPQLFFPKDDKIPRYIFRTRQLAYLNYLLKSRRTAGSEEKSLRMHARAKLVEAQVRNLDPQCNVNQVANQYITVSKAPYQCSHDVALIVANLYFEVSKVFDHQTADLLSLQYAVIHDILSKKSLPAGINDSKILATWYANTLMQSLNHLRKAYEKDVFLSHLYTPVGRSVAGEFFLKTWLKTHDMPLAVDTIKQSFKTPKIPIKRQDDINKLREMEMSNPHQGQEKLKVAYKSFFKRSLNTAFVQDGADDYLVNTTNLKTQSYEDDVMVEENIVFEKVIDED